jgi:hypothetical protein
MKRKSILILLYVWFAINIQAQSVFITLSVKWKVSLKSLSAYDSNNSNRTLKEPFLVIKYKNLSNQSIYFYKPTSKFVVNTYISGVIDSFVIKKYSKIAYNKKYNVVLDNRAFFNQPWEIINYNDDYTKEHEIDIINDCFMEINKTIFVDNFKMRNGFRKEERKIINPREVLKNKNYFCFLMPNEEYEDEFDIQGLLILKGSYRFLFSKNILSNTILENPKWSTKQKRWIYSDYHLPKKNGNYNLYSGIFHSDSILVDF